MDKLARGMIEYIRRPVLFVQQVLNTEPDTWQAEALQAIADHPRVAVRSGHGVGKTALEAWVLLWFLFTRPFPKVPCTAPTKQQLFDILWPETAKWLEKATALKPYLEWQKTRIVQRQHPERWFAVARTSNRPENLAGFHEDHLLFVVDEASGVDDRIYETIEGALTTPDSKLLLCGNPTRNTGTFHDAFTKDRALYWTRHVSCFDSRRVDPEYPERIARKYGKDSNVYRVRVLGEFPKDEPDVFIPLELAESAAMRDLPLDLAALLEIGVDVARFGDDETVLAARLGLAIVRLEPHRKEDTMATVGHIVQMARKLMEEYNKPSCTVKIDDDGVGGGVTDRLREVVRLEMLPVEVVPCHNGGTPSDQEHYENWGTEAWAHLRDLLPEMSIPNDEDLVGQLSTRKYKLTSRGRLVLESKADMKKRGLKSPDRADAVVLAFAQTAGEPLDERTRKLFQEAKFYG